MVGTNRKAKILLCNIFLSVLSLSLVFFSSNICGADGKTTHVSVDPNFIWISPGESFEINVNCVPGQPICSYSLELYFDPTLIKVNDVTIGTFFDSFPTFNNNGSIDNNAGIVSDILCLIVGNGNVTGSGTLIRVSCTSLGVRGECAFNMAVGLTNETSYLPISVINGSVIVGYNVSIKNEKPMDKATNQDKDLSKVSVEIRHRHGEFFDYFISTNPVVGNKSGFNQTNGTKECMLSNLSYGSTYQWYISVRDKLTGEWTNRSFRFTTEKKSGGGGSSGGSSGSTPIVEENLAPKQPIKPFGARFIEPDIMYSYSSHTYDPNDDMIRYRFKCGDGNLSNWTEFKEGNESVSFEYSWSTLSNCTIQLLAQDEHGLNSSWSDSLHIIPILDENDVKDQGYFNPVANFSYIVNESNNDLIMFNASTSFYFDGTIEKYYWDFGDGAIDTGIIVNHTYAIEGLYNVSLVVMDDEGKVNSKTICLYAEASVNDEKVNQQGENILFWFTIFTLLGGTTAIILLFRTRIVAMLSKPKTKYTKKSYLGKLKIRAVTNIQNINQGFKILYHKRQIKNVMHVRKYLATYEGKIMTNLQSMGHGLKILYHKRQIKNVMQAGKDKGGTKVISQSVTKNTEYPHNLDIAYKKVNDLNPIDYNKIFRNRIDEVLPLENIRNRIDKLPSLGKNNDNTHQILRNRIDELIC